MCLKGMKHRKRAWIIRVVSMVVMMGFFAGCTATRSMLDTWEDRRETLSRGLADLVDATDRAFGESRVSDAEEIVQVRVDVKPVYYHKDGFDLKAPVKVRVPLPAIERKAKFFFEFDSSADPRSSLSEAREEFVENRSITSGFLYTLDQKIKTGTKVDVYWRDDSPQVQVRPFARFEIRKDPVRFFLEEQVFWRSDEKFGSKTSFQIDRLICDRSYFRFAASAEYREIRRGADLWCALIHRRPIGDELAFSSELGASFNLHHGPPDKNYKIGDVSPGELDDDKLFSRVQVIGKFPRKWMEYTIEPGLDYYFHHEKPWDYGIVFSLRIIVFEAFLRADAQP
jgi:hypothetical protein